MDEGSAYGRPFFMARNDTHGGADDSSSTVPRHYEQLSTLFKEENKHGKPGNDPHPAEGLRSSAHRLQRCRRSSRPQSATAPSVSGPIPLPTKKEVVTILRAVHKYKDSREQFERRTHKRLIDILNPNQKTVEALMSLDLPAGVEIEIKL